jgi:hypothetical protein
VAKSISERMHYLAGYLNQLNSKGEVKKFNRDEKGYAKAVGIEPGCSVWLHHFGDSLTVGLIISQAAEKRYPAACKDATRRFQRFFNNKAVSDTWEHGLNQTKFKRYYVDVTAYADSEIMEVLNKLKKDFLTLKKENSG